MSHSAQTSMLYNTFDIFTFEIIATSHRCQQHSNPYELMSCIPYVTGEVLQMPCALEVSYQYYGSCMISSLEALWVLILAPASHANHHMST